MKKKITKMEVEGFLSDSTICFYKSFWPFPSSNRQSSVHVLFDIWCTECSKLWIYIRKKDKPLCTSALLLPVPFFSLSIVRHFCHRHSFKCCDAILVPHALMHRYSLFFTHLHCTHERKENARTMINLPLIPL